MATANELLVSLHGLAQTLPASFDLREVVDSMRARGCVRSSASARWSCSCATTRSRCGPSSSPKACGSRRTSSTTSSRSRSSARSRARTRCYRRPARPTPTKAGSRRSAGAACTPRCVPGARSSGLIALEDVVPNAYGAEQRDLIESLSSLLALSIDNARWFARLRTLGAEAERARIARELHDRVAQSLAYVAFELERMHNLPGDKDAEIAELHEWSCATSCGSCARRSTSCART